MSGLLMPQSYPTRAESTMNMVASGEKYSSAHVVSAGHQKDQNHGGLQEMDGRNVS